MSSSTLSEKLDRLASRISSYERAAVAFSGGVDSTLLLKVARDCLGEENTLGLIAVSPSLPKAELSFARSLASDIGARLDEVQTDETEDPRYKENTPRRCYFCKDVVYRTLGEYSQAAGFRYMLDGMNKDDASDIRPGRVAAREQGIISPLYDCGIGKEEIREAARELGLPNWDKPAAACLASRIPYGSEVTDAALSQIGQAELFLKQLGFATVRVRHTGDTARIEIPTAEIERFASLREKIVPSLKSMGFTYVSLDLEGFRSGSLNESLSQK